MQGGPRSDGGRVASSPSLGQSCVGKKGRHVLRRVKSGSGFSVGETTAREGLSNAGSLPGRSVRTSAPKARMCLVTWV